MAQQTMLRSGESGSQKSQSSSGTDLTGPEASGSESPIHVVSAMIVWLSETFQQHFFYCLYWTKDHNSMRHKI